MSASQQKVIIPLPDDFDEDERLEIAADIIEHIKERSRSGQGVKKVGRGYQLYDFPKYTKKYANYKGQSNVDLTLSMEMLESMIVLKSKPGEVTIGFESGSKVNAKAEGNQIGSYGQPSGNPKKARRFLGLTSEELSEIIDQY